MRIKRDNWLIGERKIILCYFLIITAIAQVYPQDQPNTRSLEFQTYDDLNEIWITQWTQDYGYDIFGNQVLYRFNDVDGNELRVSYEHYQDYDGLGNMIYFKARSWKFDPYQIDYESELTRKFRNGKLISSKELTSYDDSPWLTSKELLSYNEEGQLIKREWVESYNENEQMFRTEYYSTKGNDHCLTANTYTFYENEELIFSDSIYYESDDFCNWTKISQYRLINDVFQLRYETKWEYVYNAQNLIIESRSYLRENGQDWNLENETTREYDDEDRLIFRYEKYYPDLSEFRSFNDFDVFDNLIMRTREFYDQDLGEWVTQHIYEATFSASNKILTGSQFGGWLEEVQEYRYSEQNLYEYDENDYLIRQESNIYHWSNTEPLSKIEFETVTDYTNRCDGARLIEDYRQYDGELESNRERYLFTYWENADCEPIAKAFDIKVFPNPATDYLMVHNSESLGESRIRIVDMMGRTMLDMDYSLGNYAPINLSGFPEGIYVINIESPQGSYSKRFSKI